MILSHRLKFIFIHVAKTAGSSATTYLARYLGPRDLQLGALHECQEAGIRPNARAYFDLLRSGARITGRLAIASSGGRRLVESIDQAQRERYRPFLGAVPDHAGAERMRSYVPDAWRQYRKACFVRNPYERMVSYYLWRTRKADAPPSFSEYLEWLKRGDYSSGMLSETWRSWDLYTLDNEIAVDFIGRQENFVDDMRRLCELLDLPFKAERLCHSKRQNSYDYRDFYAPGDREVVARIFAPEIEHFGYTFGGESRPAPTSR
jgi:hypothetical protein